MKSPVQSDAAEDQAPGLLLNTHTIHAFSVQGPDSAGHPPQAAGNWEKPSTVLSFSEGGKESHVQLGSVDPIVPPGKSRARRCGLGVNLFLCSAIALFSFRYVVGVGFVPPNIAENSFKNPWLTLHVAGAATALLVSPLQLMPGVRRGRPSLHRWLGRLYVVGCTVGGIAGLPLAFGSSAGVVATVGFSLLAVAWLVTTSAGWLAGWRKHTIQHRVWMMRSFALTFAAVTLRIYLFILPALPVTFVSGYRVISFLCWVPNLIIAELFVQQMMKAC